MHGAWLQEKLSQKSKAKDDTTKVETLNREIDVFIKVNDKSINPEKVLNMISVKLSSSKICDQNGTKSMLLDHSNNLLSIRQNLGKFNVRLNLKVGKEISRNFKQDALFFSALSGELVHGSTIPVNPNPTDTFFGNLPNSLTEDFETPENINSFNEKYLKFLELSEDPRFFKQLFDSEEE